MNGFEFAVDGAWSQWGSWTGCDVTCENGTRLRTRNCDNPAPAYGGYHCVGEFVHSETCVVDTTCPGMVILFTVLLLYLLCVIKYLTILF